MFEVIVGWLGQILMDCVVFKNKTHFYHTKFTLKSEIITHLSFTVGIKNVQ